MKNIGAMPADSTLFRWEIHGKFIHSLVLGTGPRLEICQEKFLIPWGRLVQNKHHYFYLGTCINNLHGSYGEPVFRQNAIYTLLDPKKASLPSLLSTVSLGLSGANGRERGRSTELRGTLKSPTIYSDLSRQERKTPKGSE